MNSAFVVSLDFELRWGVLQRCPPGGSYEANILGARRVIPRLIDMFEDNGIRATWATVGFLFASSRDELEAFAPAIRPKYNARGVDTYAYTPGRNEQSDPLHYGGSLVKMLVDAPQQEMACHTFSHYYCNEPGQTAEAFRADLQAARAIARSKGVDLRSIVFPRNQHNPAYDTIVSEEGFETFRGNPPGSLWDFSNAARGSSLLKRAARLADQYLPVSGVRVVPWPTMEESGLCDVRASAFLRPFSPRWSSGDALRLRRIRHDMVAASRRGGIFHLWFHPHNFGINRQQNLAFLRSIIEIYRECNERYDMQSCSMADVGSTATSGRPLSLATHS